jgi:hypothetical protein
MLISKISAGKCSTFSTEPMWSLDKALDQSRGDAVNYQPQREAIPQTAVYSEQA